MHNCGSINYIFSFAKQYVQMEEVFILPPSVNASLYQDKTRAVFSFISMRTDQHLVIQFEENCTRFENFQFVTNTFTLTFRTVVSVIHFSNRYYVSKRLNNVTESQVTEMIRAVQCPC